MSRDLIAALKGQRAPSFPPPAYIRDLSPDDIQASMTTARGTTAAPLVRITHRHHQIARMTAEGRSQVDIAAETGFTQGRLSVILKEPALRDLVEYYASEVRARYLDVHTQLATLGGVAVDQLLEDLEERPHLFSVKDKLEIAEMALERSGVAPGAKHGGTPPGGGVQISISFQKPAEEPRQIIDITPVEVPNDPPAE